MSARIIDVPKMTPSSELEFDARRADWALQIPLEIGRMPDDVLERYFQQAQTPLLRAELARRERLS